MRVRGQRSLQLRFVAAGCAVVVGAAACGTTARHRRPAPVHRVGVATSSAICKPAAREAIAQQLGIGADAVTERQGKGNNDEPQCTFAITQARLSMIVNLDSSPQPYARLERTIDEATQIFSGQRFTPAPQNVPHLGLVATWLPASSQLMTTDAKRLITVTITWRHATRRREVAVATAAARPYLGRFNPKAIQQTEV